MRSDAARGAPLRIEMVLPSLEIGGMETMVAGLVRRLADRGYAVGVTCTSMVGEVGEQLRADGFRVDVVDAPGVRSMVRAPRLIEAFVRHAPDVVHVHSGVWLKAARAARAAGVPRVIHTVHGRFRDERWFEPALWRAAARYTDVVAAVSPHLHEHIVHGIGVPPARAVLLPNGVDTDRFAPGARSRILRAPLGLDDRAVLLGTVARLAPVKNLQLLVRAFAMVRAERPGIGLAIVGDGPERAELEALAAQVAPGAVHFPGAMSDIPAVCRDLDVFVLSSLAEGTSVSLLEAMASGACPVVSAVGGNPAVVDGGQAGLLFPSGDLAALADALRRVVDDADLRATIAARARARVEAHYSAAAMVTAYERLYRAERPAPRAEPATEGAGR